MGGEQGPTESEVAALVERSAKGDREAFGKLYDLYLGRIYRYAYYRAGTVVEAEDLSEEIFLKAWEGIGKFRWQGAPFSAWLFRLARNHVIDYTRTRRPASPLLESMPAREPDPADAALSNVEAAALRKLLMGLTEEQREVLLLKFIEGLSTKDVASAMNRQEGAVRALQMRALQALRRLMGDGEEL